MKYMYRQIYPYTFHKMTTKSIYKIQIEHKSHTQRHDLPFSSWEEDAAADGQRERKMKKEEASRISYRSNTNHTHTQTDYLPFSPWEEEAAADGQGKGKRKKKQASRGS
jgi:hypothetical protein